MALEHDRGVKLVPNCSLLSGRQTQAYLKSDHQGDFFRRTAALTGSPFTWFHRIASFDRGEGALIRGAWEKLISRFPLCFAS